MIACVLWLLFFCFQITRSSLASISLIMIRAYRFAILTCSDRCSAGLATDQSGPFLREAILACGESFSVHESRIVSDDRGTIVAALEEWSNGANIDAIITSGGTGFTTRDITPEATKSVLDKEAPGLVHAIMSASLKSTPMAMLSRLTAGIRNHTLIVNFPGSIKACRECFEVIKPILKHALDQLADDRPQIEQTHAKIQCEHLPKSRVRQVAVADRSRHSPFEMVSMHVAFGKIVDQIGSHFKQLPHSELIQKVTAREFYLHCGSILAEDVYASVPLPPFNASIKDGYAVIASDGEGLRKVLTKTSVAGGEAVPSLTSGFCVRISTGAAVPAGADAVVQVEDTELAERTQDNEEAVIRIKGAPKVGQDIRPIGSDIALSKESALLRQYACLGPIEAGLLASTGVESVAVFKPTIVAVMSTGDEIVSPGERRPANCIWDSNRAVLLTLLRSAHYQVIDLGIVPDTVDDTFRGIKRGLDSADCLITTGGVSMGERDLLKQVLREDFDAQIHFGRVNLKPGKPTTFATCVHQKRTKFIFALPGNPVSAYVTYQVFVKPALELLSGKYFTFVQENGGEMFQLLSAHKTIKCKLTLNKPYKLDPRPEFVRTIVSFPKTNSAESDPLSHFPTVHLTEYNQISSRLLNVKDANALVMLKSSSENGSEFLNSETFVDAILL